jgi:hypothetical protein
MKPLQNFLLATTAALAGWASVMLASSSACTHQLTVEEADSTVVVSCVALAQVMTKDTPAILDRVIAQVCQPGRTRESIDRIISRLSAGEDVVEVWPGDVPRDAGAR